MKSSLFVPLSILALSLLIVLAVVLVAMVLLALPSSAYAQEVGIACPWSPPPPPPPVEPPLPPAPPTDRSVPPEDIPGPPPEADFLPPPDSPPSPPDNPPSEPGLPPPHEPTWIEAPWPRGSDGPSPTQKIILRGRPGIYEFYGRGSISFATHQPAVAVRHEAEEVNEYRDVTLTDGYVEYMLPVGLTYLFRWTEEKGHEYIRAFYVVRAGYDLEILVP